MLHHAPDTAAPWFRLRIAEAWGSMAEAWGLPPAVARTQGLLLAAREPMSERQVRDALGLSHRAASIALERCVELGLAVRVEGRRVGQRGPVGAAYQAVADDWAWFGRVLAERVRSEMAPLAASLDEIGPALADASAGDPGDAALTALADWLGAFRAHLAAVETAAASFAALDPRSLEARFRPRPAPAARPSPSPSPVPPVPPVPVAVTAPPAPIAPPPPLAPAAPAPAEPVWLVAAQAAVRADKAGRSDREKGKKDKKGHKKK